MSMINSEFERLSGYSKQETEGNQLWTDFIYPENLEMMIQLHKQRRISPETTPRHYKCRVFKKTGNKREVRTAKTPESSEQYLNRGEWFRLGSVQVKQMKF